jgi:hypothetical protein
MLVFQGTLKGEWMLYIPSTLNLNHSWPLFDNDTSYIVFEVANLQIMCSWCMNCGILNEYDTVDTKYLILI